MCIRDRLETSQPTGEVDSEQIAARPHLTLSSNGRSGFGTGPTGARITVGGALVAEQVIILTNIALVKAVCYVKVYFWVRDTRRPLEFRARKIPLTFQLLETVKVIRARVML